MKSGIDTFRPGTVRIYLRLRPCVGAHNPKASAAACANACSCPPPEPGRDAKHPGKRTTCVKMRCTPAQAGAKPDFSKIQPGAQAALVATTAGGKAQVPGFWESLAGTAPAGPHGLNELVTCKATEAVLSSGRTQAHTLLGPTNAPNALPPGAPRWVLLYYIIFISASTVALPN